MMTDLPSWVVDAVEVLFYVVIGPPLVVWVVFCAGFIIVVIVHPIWVAVRGRDYRKPVDPFTRTVAGLVGLGLLWSFIRPWL